MPRLAVVLTGVCLTLTLGLSVPAAAEQTTSQHVFGESIMTRDEVDAFKSKLANCSTAQERATVEAEHKERMIQRARWKGMVLDRDAKTVTMAGNN